jgi:hypothetical protein
MAGGKVRQDRGEGHGGDELRRVLDGHRSRTVEPWTVGRFRSVARGVRRQSQQLPQPQQDGAVVATASVTPSDGVFTRTFRWAGREGHVHFIVVANEKLRKIGEVGVPWRAADEAEMLQGHTDRRRFSQTECK